MTFQTAVGTKYTTRHAKIKTIFSEKGNGTETKSENGLEDSTFLSSEFENDLPRENFVARLRILKCGRYYDDEELALHYRMHLLVKKLYKF